MDIIPVIDVQHGVAVRASGGRRDGYRSAATRRWPRAAIRSLSRGGSARSLPFPSSMSPTSTASRDAAAMRVCRPALAAALPGVDLWIDDGAPRAEVACSPSSHAQVATPVVGSESLKGERRRGGAAGAAAGPLRAVARFQGRPLRRVRRPFSPSPALARPRHRDDACPRRQRRGPRPAPRRRHCRAAPANGAVYAAGGVQRPCRRRGVARGGGGRRAHRQCAALRNDYGRRSGRRSPAADVSSCEEVEQNGVPGLYPFHRPVSSLPNRCSRPAFIGGASSCCGRFPLQVFAPNGCCAELRWAVASAAVGLPATARAIDSLTAR